MSLKIQWLGHASFLIKDNGKTIYIDPYEGEYREKADLILVSHSHFDHCDISKINKIRTDKTVIIAPSDCAKKIGGNIRVIKPGDTVEVNSITVEVVDAYNYKRFRAPGTPFHPKGLGVGYVITVDGKRVYHAGDTDFVPEMKKLKDIYVALLPCGGTYTMDIPEAAEAAKAINPEIAVPMHLFGKDPMEFKRIMEKMVPQISVVVLKKGKEYTLQK